MTIANKLTASVVDATEVFCAEIAALNEQCDELERERDRYLDALERIALQGEGARRAYYAKPHEENFGIAGTLASVRRIARAALDGDT